MANPSGVPKMSSDANVQDVYFKFTIGASGAVTAKDFSTDIKDITLGSAGTYNVLLREQWSDIAGVEIRSISTTFHQFQVTQNNVATATPSVVFITAVSDGTPVAENLANPTQIRGHLQLRNGPK